jgi:hypothetical protein
MSVPENGRISQHEKSLEGKAPAPRAHARIVADSRQQAADSGQRTAGAGNRSRA